MKQNYAKLYRKSTYTFLYLAKSINKLTQTNNFLSLGHDANGWIGKEQPFAPIAPPSNGGSNV
tara:strand:- start:115 stop:303 length:189 start_codon:yes stop_codon:yes gene_type:complete